MRVQPGLGLVGHSPAPALAGAQGPGSTNRPPPPPRPPSAASQRPDRPVRLQGYTPSLGRRPRHAMPRPGRTAYAAPRHPERDIAPCCAPGQYCLHPRTATSPSPWPCNQPASSGTAADGSATRIQALGDILTVLPRGISITEVSVVHLISKHLLHPAATTAGVAASHHEQQKRTTYAWLEPNSYEFVPVCGVVQALEPAGHEAVTHAR
jgi:hypothetical protein